MAKHTSKKNNEVDTKLESVRGIFESLNVPYDTIADIISDVKKSIPKTQMKKRKPTAKEILIRDMDEDNSQIKNIQDSFMYILKYTAKCFQYGFYLPFSELVYSSSCEDALDQFQFAVSALEHNLNPKMIKNCDYINIYEYAPDCSMIGSFGNKLRQALLGPCRDLVSEMLSKINPAKLNVGTEQDIIDFKRRHGLK